jgi:hypothetical protein
MRIGRLRILASIVVILLAYVFFTMIQQGFTPFEYARFPVNASLIPIDGGVGAGVSTTLWSERQLDLILLAVLLFATATCCTTMLNLEKGEHD